MKGNGGGAWKINTIVKKMELLGREKMIEGKRAAEERRQLLSFSQIGRAEMCTCARPQMCQDGRVCRKCPETTDPAAGERLALPLLCLRHAQFSSDWSVLKSEAAKLTQKLQNSPN